MAGVLKIKVDAIIEGPLADGTASKVTTEWAEKVTQKLGDLAVGRLKELTPHKTGRGDGAFERELTPVRKSPTQVSVTGPQERGVTWAPWLEGSSKRNESTKYPGIHMFRTTRRELDKQAAEVGQKVLDELMPEIGGE